MTAKRMHLWVHQRYSQNYKEYRVGSYSAILKSYSSRCRWQPLKYTILYYYITPIWSKKSCTLEKWLITILEATSWTSTQITMNQTTLYMFRFALFALFIILEITEFRTKWTNKIILTLWASRVKTRLIYVFLFLLKALFVLFQELVYFTKYKQVSSLSQAREIVHLKERVR